LKNKGIDSSFSNRTSLFYKYGGTGAYKGSTEQNIWLLEMLKKDYGNNTTVSTDIPVVAWLKSMNRDSSFSARTKYYYDLGGTGTYAGNTDQNIWLLQKLKEEQAKIEEIKKNYEETMKTLTEVIPFVSTTTTTQTTTKSEPETVFVKIEEAKEEPKQVYTPKEETTTDIFKDIEAVFSQSIDFSAINQAEDFEGILKAYEVEKVKAVNPANNTLLVSDDVFAELQAVAMEKQNKLFLKLFEENYDIINNIILKLRQAKDKTEKMNLIFPYEKELNQMKDFIDTADSFFIEYYENGGIIPQDFFENIFDIIETEINNSLLGNIEIIKKISFKLVSILKKLSKNSIPFFKKNKKLLKFFGIVGITGLINESIDFVFANNEFAKYWKEVVINSKNLIEKLINLNEKLINQEIPKEEAKKELTELKKESKKINQDIKIIESKEKENKGFFDLIGLNIPIPKTAQNILAGLGLFIIIKNIIKK